MPGTAIRAGVQKTVYWMPAFAGMTIFDRETVDRLGCVG